MDTETTEVTPQDRYTIRRKRKTTPGFVLFSKPEPLQQETESMPEATEDAVDASPQTSSPQKQPDTPPKPVKEPPTDPTAPDPVEAAKIKAKRRQEEAKAAEKDAKKDQKRSDIPILPRPTFIAKPAGSIWVDVNSKTGSDNTVLVWKYWQETYKSFPNRLLVYMYRLHPVYHKPQGEATGEKIYELNYDAQPDFGNFTHFVLSRWGSGNYRFVFRDEALAQNLFTMNLNGLWDFKNFPPIIPVDQVDLSHPNNKSYINDLRRSGVRLPGDTEYRTTEENSMPDPNAAATAAATSTLVSTVRDLAMNRGNNGDPASGIESVNKAWTGVVDKMTDVFKTAQSTQAHAADPTTHVQQVIELAKQLTPPPVDISAIFANNAAQQKQSADTIAALQQQSQAAIAAADARADRTNDMLMKFMLQSEQDKAVRMERELSELRKKLETPSSPLQSPMSMLKEIIELKKEFDGLGGGAAEAEDAPAKGAPWWAALLPMAMPVIDKLATVGIQLMRTPNPPPQQVYQQPPAQTQQGQIPQPPVQQPQPQGAPEQMNEMTVFFMTLAQPLMKYLNDATKDGVDFALYFIDGHGESAYSQLAAIPKETMIQLMKEHASGPLTGNLWSKISIVHRDVPGDTMPTPQFDKFLTEFLDQEEVNKALKGIKEDKEAFDEEDEVLTPEVISPEPTPIGPKRPRTLQ